MPSSFPAPANKTYDFGISEVVDHLTACERSQCPHLKELRNKFGLVTVLFAIDKINGN